MNNVSTASSCSSVLSEISAISSYAASGKRCCSDDTLEVGECNRNMSSADTIRTHTGAEVAPRSNDQMHLGCFSRYLALWVILCMVIGTAIGTLVPALTDALEKATVSGVWIPGVVLVWLMIYPMMLGVRWSALKEVGKHPTGLILTTTINWAVQPFVMYGLAVLFFDVVYSGVLSPEEQSQYISGAVILGGSPCTAMVFVWSSMADGNPTYTLIQVLLNDLILLILYVPTTKLLLSISDIILPWDTVFLSVVLFVVVPGLFGVATHLIATGQGDYASLEQVKRISKPISAASLLLLVAFIFMSQAQVIKSNWVHILLIIVPLVLQTTAIFVLAYSSAYGLCLEHNIAGPAAFIGSSNFFELAVALALTLYGPQSAAVLVTVVGVLVEVPVMLIEVAIVKATKQRFDRRMIDQSCYCNKED